MTLKCTLSRTLYRRIDMFTTVRAWERQIIFLTKLKEVCGSSHHVRIEYHIQLYRKKIQIARS